MSILFTGAAPYEFVNVSALVTTGNTFDPVYTDGCFAKTTQNDIAAARFFKTTVEQEVWVHAKLFLGEVLSSTVNANPVLMLHSASLEALGGLRMRGGSLILSSDGTEVNVTGLVTRGLLYDADIHMFQFGSIRVVELYLNGNFVAEARDAATWVAPTQLFMAGSIGSTNYFSEILVTEGNAPTLGARVYSRKPDPSLPGLNTFDSGYWGALANGSLTDGVVTEDAGARITGGFMAYAGPAEPLGIRAVVHSGRYLKNGTLLELKGQLRIDDVNYDTPDAEYDDGNRLISIWEENPATTDRFEVADFAGLQGGFYTVLGS